MVPFVLACVLVFTPGISTLSSFGNDKEQANDKNVSYAAKVGNRIITFYEYNKAVDKLHTTSRVGEGLAGVQAPSFEKPDYKGFLDELIERELIIGEAEKLGLDKDEKFKEKVATDRLNLLLEMLKQEEVRGKAKITPEEVRRYYDDVESKSIEKALLEKKEKDPSVEVNVKKFDELSASEVTDLNSKLYVIKVKDIEAEYLKKVRKEASVKIYKKDLGKFSGEDIGTWDAVVAKVESAEITGRDLAIEMRRRRVADTEKEAVLEKLILAKALDSVALTKGYEKKPEVAARLKKIYDDALSSEFRAKVIVPLVKISDEDIKGYYEKNKDKFRESDMLYLRGIIAGNEADAKSIIKELKKGANFAFLAEKLSLDPASGKKGGDIGWVAANTLPEELLKDSAKAKKGKILGPYQVSNHIYVVYEFRERKAGIYTPLENRDVRDTIRVTLGRERFKENYDSYLKTLRSTVPIEINEAIFKGLKDTDEKKQ
ncbi:MAG: peptidyl-prolyl cis-trans isomerase [Deltaproteobacteria bacterium]|nr:peptidyl-prolyl cis-trans isomerase [Deltaproteobacteria bacterium]